MRLHWHPFSIIPRRVRIALAEKSIPHEDVIVDVLSGAHREPAFRQLNPLGLIPVLEDDGLVICESIAILEYLEERFPAPALLPRETGVRATARQFMQWSGDRQLIHAWETWMKPAFAVAEPVDGPGRDRAHDDLAAHLDILERRLSGRTWIVDQYSFADICYAPFVTVFERVGLGHLIAARPAVRAWVERLEARPAVRDTAPPPVPLSLPPRSPAPAARR